MVDSFNHVYNNVNQFYMAGLMAAPMVLIELVVMRGMHHDNRLNAFIAGASVVAGILMFVSIRQQTAVGRSISAIDDPAPLRRHPGVPI